LLQVLAELFPDELAKKLAESDSILALLTCGAAVIQEESRQQIIGFAQK
jgi:hypothetical protein